MVTRMTTPSFGLGSIVRHRDFGRGRVVGYDQERYVMLFPGGDGSSARGNASSAQSLIDAPALVYPIVGIDAGEEVRRDVGSEVNDDGPAQAPTVHARSISPDGPHGHSRRRRPGRAGRGRDCRDVVDPYPA